MRKSLLARIPLLTAFVLVPSCVEGLDEPPADDPRPVDTASKGIPELGETADSVTAGVVEASARATSEASDDVPSATAWSCNQFGWGQVCARTNDNYNFVGVFNNNRGGTNTVRITLWRDTPGGDTAEKQCDWHTVVYGDSHRCVDYSPIAGEYYRACVRLYNGENGCSGWSQVK
jgi:hypothetical protein